MPDALHDTGTPPAGGAGGKLLTVALQSYFSGPRIEKAYLRLSDLLGRENIPFEFVVLDDGSADDSYERAARLARARPNVRAYRLSRNYGQANAGFAACSVARGACMMPIPDDEQQPYETIVAAYREWEAGHKIVLPYRRTRDDPFLSSLFSRGYYAVMNALSEIRFPPGGCDMALFDREVIDIINRSISHRHTFIVAELLRLGFSPKYLPYDRPIGLNRGKSRWTLKKKVRLALDTFIAASSFPIKLISLLGLFFSALAILAGFFYAYVALFGNLTFWGARLPGWTSLFLAVTFFSGLILFSLGIIAEYIYRIFEEVKHRPAWIIRKDEPGPGPR